MPRSALRSGPLWLCITLALTVLSWGVLFPIHRPANIDDAWTASYIWNLIKMGTPNDLVMGDSVSNIAYFGHIHAYILSFLADTFGWTHAVFHGFNLLCLLFAAPAWYLIGKKLLHSSYLAAWFILFLYLTGSFIGCAYVARSDAFAFMLFSWGTCLAAYNKFFFATSICSIAIETHAISATGYFYISVFFIHYMKQSKDVSKYIIITVIKCIIGICIGFIVYRFLHHESLKEIIAYLFDANTKRTAFNALTAHYFQREYMRFIPELLFLATGGVLFFWRRQGREPLHSPLALLFIAALAASVIIKRANFHYVPFFYPPLFLVALAGYCRARIFTWAAVAFITYCLVLAGGLAFLNRRIDRATFDREILQAVPRDSRAIIGPSNAWFAFHDRFFYVRYAAWQKAGHADPLAYFIDSRYSNRLPACARTLAPVGPPVVFNASPMRAFLVDLSACDGTNQP